MNRLTLHIEYLLQHYDCVIVPDFGSFITVYRDAYIDSQTGRFYPMSREVRFNSAVRHDDSMLATSYSRRDKITYYKARELMISDIEKLKHILNSDKEATLGRIGTISMEENNSYVFHPYASPDELAAELGFFPVQTINTSIRQENDITRVSGNYTEHRTDSRRKNRYYYLPVNKRFIHVAAMLIAVLGIALSIFLPLKRGLNEDQASVVPVKIITEALTGTDKSVNAQSKTDNTISATDFNDNGSIADAIPDSLKTWQLIIGTFRTPDEAAGYISSLKIPGYTYQIIKGSRLYRVAAAESDNKEDMVSILNGREFHKAFPEAWIYRINPQQDIPVNEKKELH